MPAKFESRPPPEVLLVSPHVDRIVQVRDAVPSKSLGLAYVAAALQRAGARVEVLDGKGLGGSERELVERIVALSPRLVGFTAMTHELGRAAALAAGVKQRAPGIATLLGGAHANALPSETLERFPQFDLACQGEGEESVVELARVLADAPARGPTAAAGIAGISFRDRSRVVRGAARAAIADLDRLPFPAWELFPWTPHFMIYTARGCPYRCNFCMRAMGSRYRARSCENVVDELSELVERHRMQSFTFEDETFMIDRARTYRLLDLIGERGLSRLRWMANLHAKTVDDELADRLAAAGCVSVGTGVESGNPGVLGRAGKGLTVERARQAVRTLKRAGLEVRTFFIFGHPHETWSTALDTVRLAAELAPDQASFGIMVPYPDTEVAAMAARGDGGYRLLSLDWADYDKYLGHALELVALPRPHLEFLQVLGYLWLYLRNGRFGDLARFAWKHRGAARALVAKMLRGMAGRVPRVGAEAAR